MACGREGMSFPYSVFAADFLFMMSVDVRHVGWTTS